MPDLTDDQIAEDYEGFSGIYYDYDATDLQDDRRGLYALDGSGRVVGHLPYGNVDDYMLWVYLNLK